MSSSVKLSSKTISTGNFEVNFNYFSCGTKVDRPCSLNALVRRSIESSYDWAFLQVYEEVFPNGLTLGPYVDVDPLNPVIVPFYSASLLSVWSGKFSDEPFDNHNCSWKLKMYTLFCEVDTLGQQNFPINWKYYKKFGVFWGFKKNLPNKPQCLTLKRMTVNEIGDKFRALTNKFSGLSLL